MASAAAIGAVAAGPWWQARPRALETQRAVWREAAVAWGNAPTLSGEGLRIVPGTSPEAAAGDPFVLAALEKAQVPSGKVYDVADIVKDAHFIARGMLEEHRLPDGKPVKLPGIVPKLSATPGATKWIGPKLGEHTDEVLEALGYAEAARAKLRERGIV